MRRFAIAGAAVAAITIAAVAVPHAYGHHRGGPGGPGMGGRAMMMQLFEYFDANADGAVGKEEAKGVAAEKRAAFDGDGSGALSIDEFAPLWNAATRRMMVRGFQRLDADGDGQLTAAEMDSRIDRLFARADRNGDGALDPSDRRKGGWRGGRGEGRDGPRGE